MFKKILLHSLVFFVILFINSIAATFIIGSFLPNSFEQVRTRNFYTDKQMLWTVLTDIDNYPLWKPNTIEVDVVQNNVQISGFTEFDSIGRRKFWEVLDWQSQERLNIKTTPSKRYSQEIEYTLRQKDTMVMLSIRLLGKYQNPFQRFTQRFVHNQNTQLDKILISIDDQIKRIENSDV